MATTYYLLDLERTIGNCKPYFWKGNKHGYTDAIQFAGRFPKAFAEKICKQDYYKNTVMIPETLIEKILGTDLKQHEGISN